MGRGSCQVLHNALVLLCQASDGAGRNKRYAAVSSRAEMVGQKCCQKGIIWPFSSPALTALTLLFPVQARSAAAPSIAAAYPDPAAAAAGPSTLLPATPAQDACPARCQRQPAAGALRQVETAAAGERPQGPPPPPARPAAAGSGQQAQHAAAMSLHADGSADAMVRLRTAARAAPLPALHAPARCVPACTHVVSAAPAGRSAAPALTRPNSSTRASLRCSTCCST